MKKRINLFGLLFFLAFAGLQAQTPYFYYYNSNLLSVNTSNNVHFMQAYSELYDATSDITKQLHFGVENLESNLITSSSHLLITSPSHLLISIAHLPAGIYFVKITSEAGIQTQKVIKL